MPMCIECRCPVSHLYTTYSKADDRSLGKGVQLTQCPQCRNFADKYVEHDFVVIFIDLVLIKPQTLTTGQVYRHLLFNRLHITSGTSNRSIVRLGVLLLLFDVYLTWARVEKSSLGNASATSSVGACENGAITIVSSQSPSPSPPIGDDQLQLVAISPFAILPSLPLIIQYFFYLALCTLSQLSFHVPIRLLYLYAPTALTKLGILPEPELFFEFETDGTGSNTTSGSPSAMEQAHQSSGDKSHSHDDTTTDTLSTIDPQPAAPPDTPSALTFSSTAPISTAIIVSSGTKLFPLLLLIWNYDLPSSATALNCVVTINNISALKILIQGEDAGPSGLITGPTEPTVPPSSSSADNSPVRARQRQQQQQQRRQRRRSGGQRRPLVGAVFLVAVGALFRVTVVAAVLTGLGLILGRSGEMNAVVGATAMSSSSSSASSSPHYGAHPPALFPLVDGDPCVIQSRKAAPLELVVSSSSVTATDSGVSIAVRSPVVDGQDSPSTEDSGQTTISDRVVDVADPGRTRVYTLLDPWTIWQLSWRCGLGFMLT